MEPVFRLTSANATKDFPDSHVQRLLLALQVAMTVDIAVKESANVWSDGHPPTVFLPFVPLVSMLSSAQDMVPACVLEAVVVTKAGEVMLAKRLFATALVFTEFVRRVLTI